MVSRMGTRSAASVVTSSQRAGCASDATRAAVAAAAVSWEEVLASAGTSGAMGVEPDTTGEESDTTGEDPATSGGVEPDAGAGSSDDEPLPRVNWRRRYARLQGRAILDDEF